MRVSLYAALLSHCPRQEKKVHLVDLYIKPATRPTIAQSPQPDKDQAQPDQNRSTTTTAVSNPKTPTTPPPTPIQHPHPLNATQPAFLCARRNAHTSAIAQKRHPITPHTHYTTSSPCPTPPPSLPPPPAANSYDAPHAADRRHRRAASNRPSRAGNTHTTNRRRRCRCRFRCWCATAASTRAAARSVVVA